MRKLLILLLFSLTVGLPLRAAAAPKIVFRSIAQVEVEKVDERGNKILERQPAELVPPGTVVIYVNSFTNEGTDPANNLVITNPIPKGTEYIAGSASEDVGTVTFSADGANSYAPAEQLFVPDGKGGQRLATPGEYSHIRWQLTSPLPSDSTGTVEFRALVK